MRSWTPSWNNGIGPEDLQKFGITATLGIVRDNPAKPVANGYTMTPSTENKETSTNVLCHLVDSWIPFTLLVTRNEVFTQMQQGILEIIDVDARHINTWETDNPKTLTFQPMSGVPVHSLTEYGAVVNLLVSCASFEHHNIGLR